MRILIIEDERKVAAFIRKGLQQEGYAVDVVYEGQEDAYQAESFDYDAVILDLMLPQLPGFEVLRKIRAHKQSLPVLILTARGSVKDKVAGLDGGASDYLVKPFAFVELSARIRVLLRRGTQEPSFDGFRTAGGPLRKLDYGGISRLHAIIRDCQNCGIQMVFILVENVHDVAI